MVLMSMYGLALAVFMPPMHARVHVYKAIDSMVPPHHPVNERANQVPIAVAVKGVKAATDYLSEKFSGPYTVVEVVFPGHIDNAQWLGNDKVELHDLTITLAKGPSSIITIPLDDLGKGFLFFFDKEGKPIGWDMSSGTVMSLEYMMHWFTFSNTISK